VLAEVRQMAVSLEALAGFLSALPAPVTVALESCLYWQWLHDQLDAQGHTVRVADPRQVKVIAVPALLPRFPASLSLSYCDSSAFAGLSRAARRAGMTVDATVIAVIRMVEPARISGSAALIA